MRFLLGNMISLGAAAFLIASCLAHDRRRVYACLCGESLFLAVAQAVLGMPAGAAVQLIAVLRNALLAFSRFGRGEAIFFSLLTLVCGVAADLSALTALLGDVRFLLRLLPIAAGIQLTLGAYFSRTLRGAKLAVLCNAFLWLVYAIYASDVVTALSGACVLVLDLLTFLGNRREKRQKNAKNRHDPPQKPNYP